MKKVVMLILLTMLAIGAVACTAAPKVSVSQPTPEPAVTADPSPSGASTPMPASTQGPDHMTEQTPAPTPDTEPEPFEEIGKIELTEGFYYIELNDVIKQRITGQSYPAQDSLISYDDLRYLRLLHYSFEGEVCEGEMIVHAKLADEVLEIFYELYKAQYPLTSVKLVDDFGADDYLSMEANNTSAFNYRFVTDSQSLSLHGYGAAIDINPMLNPFVDGDYVSPANGAQYADRSQNFAGKIDKKDLCYRLFTKRGWKWGGSWRSYKDYQHFFKDIR